jgi:acyl carrier protein
MTNTEALTLFAHLLHGVAPEVDVAEVDHNVPFQDECDLDSMDFLNLITALQKETGIDIPERDYARVSTITGFVAYLTQTSANRTRS